MKNIAVKIAILALASPLALQSTPLRANGGESAYKQRAAQADLSLFRELDRARTGVLNRNDVRGDLNLGPRFDDIDTNRDEIVTLQEMQAYIEKTYGVLPAPG